MSLFQLLPFLLAREKEMEEEELFNVILQQKLSSAKATESHANAKGEIDRALSEVKADLAILERSKEIAEVALKFQEGKLSEKREDSSSSSGRTKSRASNSEAEPTTKKKKEGSPRRSRRTRS